MKREAKLLLDKSINSLIISVDYFNSSHDAGRSTAVLLMLYHSFEMLLKASLVQRGADIYSGEKHEGDTIGYVDCVNKAFSDGEVKFLSEEQKKALYEISLHRNAEQHHLNAISEQRLYITVQSGFTIFRDILNVVFSQDLTGSLPERVLPITTAPPLDLQTIYWNETDTIRQFLQPGKRQRTLARASIRSLQITENALLGLSELPADKELDIIAEKIRSDENLESIFPSVAQVELTTKGYGPSLELRITKKEGLPVRIVDEDTPEAGAVAIKRVAELGYYSMNLTQLRKKVDAKLSQQRALAIIWFLDLKSDEESYKEFKFGKSTVHKRYSSKTLEKIREALPSLDVDEIWRNYNNRQR